MVQGAFRRRRQRRRRQLGEEPRHRRGTSVAPMTISSCCSRASNLSFKWRSTKMRCLADGEPSRGALQMRQCAVTGRRAEAATAAPQRPLPASADVPEGFRLRCPRELRLTSQQAGESSKLAVFYGAGPQRADWSRQRRRGRQSLLALPCALLLWVPRAASQVRRARSCLPASTQAPSQEPWR